MNNAMLLCSNYLYQYEYSNILKIRHERCLKLKYNTKKKYLILLKLNIDKLWL